jgi:hypothetical protein
MMSTERAYPLRGRPEVTAQGGAVLFTPISGNHQPGSVGPKGAISGRKPGRGQASKSALAWQSDLSYKVGHERFACHGA